MRESPAMGDQRAQPRRERLAAIEGRITRLEAELARTRWALIAFGVLFLLGKACRWW